MAEQALNGPAALSRSSELTEAIKEAFIAACIAFLMFSVIVGIKTSSSSGSQGLVLHYRLVDALLLSVGVGIVRLIFDLFFWRRLFSQDGKIRFLPSGTLRIVLTALLALSYVLGAVYFFSEAGSDATGQLLSSLFGVGSQESIENFVTFTSVLFLGVFVIITAMIVVLAARRLLGMVVTGGAAATAGSEQPASLTQSFRQQFAPALLAVAVILPILVAGPQERYALDTAIQVLTYIMLGWGLNIVVGLAGLLDLGYVAFYAVGAYSYALIATEFGWSFWVCLPLAGAFAALWGIILGFPVLRLRGDYLAIVTLAFGEIIRVVLLNWYSLTNGPDGITRIPSPSFFGLDFARFGDGEKFHTFFGLDYNPIYRIIFMYYLILILALMVNFATNRLRRLPIGRAWEAMREDEIACRSLGINITTTKLTAFAIGAMFAGFAGSFFATRQGFISPESFTFQESAIVLAIVVLGGLGSQIGVVVAAVAFIGAFEFFRELSEYRMLIFGMSMVAIMVWRPRGLISSRAPTVVLKERKTISGDLVREGTG
jgi:branched-chain amino acid transport system permease protein